MGFAVAQIVDRWRASQLSLCLARSVHLTSLTVLVLRLFSQVLTCWRETLGLKDLEMSLKDKGGYESWTLPQLREELRARKARVSGHKTELIERCVPDRVILTVGNVHLNHVNECDCFVTKAQLCGAPPTEWVSGEPHCEWFYMEWPYLHMIWSSTALTDQSKGQGSSQRLSREPQSDWGSWSLSGSQPRSLLNTLQSYYFPSSRKVTFPSSGNATFQNRTEISLYRHYRLYSL